MNLPEALEQIHTIHNHVARGESYRGYHPQALASCGLVGLIAAALQAWVLPAADPLAFLLFWTATACLAGGVSAAPTLYDYLTLEDPLARRKTRIIARQFVPCLLVGMVLTSVLARPEYRVLCLPLLPGLWAMLYGLGTLALVPYLPRGAGTVAAWYLVGGAILLTVAPGPVPPGWTVGVPFGIGHLLAAGVLIRDRTAGRSHDH